MSLIEELYKQEQESKRTWWDRFVDWILGWME